MHEYRGSLTLSQSSCTKPGGYVELCEVGGELFSDDDTVHPGSDRVVRLLNDEALPKLGRPPPTGDLLASRLEEAGFTDITSRQYKQILGPWPKALKQKQIGAMSLLKMATAVEAYAGLALTRILGMSTEEAQKTCDDGFRGFKSRHHHMYSW